MSMFRSETANNDAAIKTVLGGQDAAAGSALGRWTCDPMEPDAPGDEILVTSSRRLLRVALAAADAGARFALEDLEQDAAAWMLTPRALFGGRPAIEACQDLEDFSRSIVLHGLRLGMGADPDAINVILANDGPPCTKASTGIDAQDGKDVDPSQVRLPRPLLLTCWIDGGETSVRLFAFCGLVTDRPADLVERVIGRYGAKAAAAADFCVGFDQTTSMATAMISEAMTHMLMMAADDPASPLAHGLDVVVEQRFAA